MDKPSLPDRSISSSKRHSRNVSNNRTPLARRSTRGPLDVEDPLATSPTHQDPPSLDKASTADIDATSRPDIPSSARGGASTAISSPIRPPPLEIEEKDLSFLLHPQIYTPLPPPPSYLPPPTQSPSAPLPALLASHDYRHAAQHCAQRLSSIPAPPQPEIFNLFYTRLTCLILLGLTPLAAQESRALEDINAPFYRTRDGKHILPWDLRVLVARLAAGASMGDVKRSIAAFYELAREARLEAQKTTSSSSSVSERQVWRSRLEQCGLGVANVLVESGDLQGAARHLEGMMRSGPGANEKMLARLTLVYLAMGDIDAAVRCLESAGRGREMLTPLLLMADGKYPDAIAAWRALPQDCDLVTQNLAVCLFYNGQVDETVRLLEGLVEQGRSFHALTFNLATCFELTSERASYKKRELAEQVTRTLREKEDYGERGAGSFKL